VYPYVPIPNGAQQMGVPLQTYEHYAPTPLGYPGPLWSGAPAVKPGQEEQVAQPLGIQWSQGFGEPGSKPVY
jgi:hypothetical protein